MVILAIVSALAMEVPTSSAPSKNAISIELGGSGVAYSLQFSHRFTRQWGINAGLSYLPMDIFAGIFGERISLTQVPLSASFFLGKERHFLEIAAGGNYYYLEAELSSPTTNLNLRTATSGFYPVAALGYRYWPSKSGAHFRVTAHLAAVGGEVLLLPGLGFGLSL